MSAGVNIEGVSETKKFLANLSGQMPFALALAQTRTAKIVKEAEKDQMRKDIDRPTPWSIGALMTEGATKAGRKARVWFKDPFGHKAGLGGEDYLGVHIVGGERTRARRSEKRLQLAGLMKKGHVWAPAKGVRLNQYGNVSGSLLTKILSNLGTIDTARNTGTAAKTLYVVGTWGAKKTPAIFQVIRGGKDLKPILWLVKSPKYTPRYRFYERANTEIERHLVTEGAKAIDYALRTAK